LKHFPNSTRSADEHQDVAELMFTNTHPALGFIRPITPNTIQLGSLHLKPPKPIQNQELKDLLDSTNQGVIFMSLGSNVKSRDLSDESKSIFLNVFRKLQYQVLWKFEDDHLNNRSENVMIAKWFPQADLLAHPNVKLFITQGGLMSLEEAIDRETPVIVIPFLLDQNRNALKTQEEEFGLRLDIDELTEKKLEDAINEMMKPKYSENIKKFKQIMNDQPMTSIEKAVWWTEYVIRNKGARHLKYSGRNVPFYQKIWLDIIMTFLLIFYLVRQLKKAIQKPFNRKMKKD
jgi:glucuronosyltransferase